MERRSRVSVDNDATLSRKKASYSRNCFKKKTDRCVCVGCESLARAPIIAQKKGSLFETYRLNYTGLVDCNLPFLPTFSLPPHRRSRNRLSRVENAEPAPIEPVFFFYSALVCRLSLMCFSNGWSMMRPGCPVLIPLRSWRIWQPRVFFFLFTTALQKDNI